MAYVESHQSLRNHRKLARVVSAWGVGRPEAIGYLHLLWWWCLDNVGPDGDLGDLTPAELALGADWPGDPQVFFDGLVYAGFVDETDGRYCLHDWFAYAGKYTAKRERDRRQAAERYAARKRAPGETQNEKPARSQRESGETRERSPRDRNQTNKTNKTNNTSPNLQPTTGEASPPQVQDSSLSHEPNPPAADDAGRDAERRRRSRSPMDDPGAREVAAAVYDAMKSGGLPPSGGQRWWAKACAASRSLAPPGREVAGAAAAWALRQPEPRRGIYLRDLSECRFAPVIDAYNAAVNGSYGLTPDQRRVLDLPFWGEEVVEPP
jgi:hypothetical protein